MMPTVNRLTDLRALMTEQNLDAYLITSADEHLNEFLPETKRHRQWMSGFSGSAGDLLVGKQAAWLFVDFRYYEQAELEVNSSLIHVVRVGLTGQKNLAETLEDLGQQAKQAGAKFCLGYNPFTVSVNQFKYFKKQLKSCGIVLMATENLVEEIRLQQAWMLVESLPDFTNTNVEHLSDAITGETIQQKLSRVREAMEQKNANLLVITKLDQIAWLFNLRGGDVPYNPLVIAYSIVTTDKAFLFTNLHRIAPELQHLLEEYATLMPYEQYPETLNSLVTQSTRVLLDPKDTTMGTYQILTEAGSQIVEVATNPIDEMKGRKNSVELAHIRQANLKASRAKTRTLKWISDQISHGNTLSEADVAANVEGFYAEESCQGLSFNTIAAAGSHSSIVHYSTPNPEALLQPSQFFLLDSGTQFPGATTDDTRTTIIGEPTPEQIKCYTEVLKSHITLAMQRFPQGTTGTQLDAIARSSLWQAGLDFGHGTGHGVGAGLCVHEGPHRLHKQSLYPLEAGMVTSIEPGYYKPNWGGIRLENLYVVKELPPENGSTWYSFEPLTYIPFDKRVLDLSRLSPQQLDWLQQYHAAVVEQLSPALDSEEVFWLRETCSL